MWLSPGDTLRKEFTTASPSNGQSMTADSLPVAVLAQNGVADVAVTVTVTLLETGRYLATCVIPGDYTAGDTVSLRVTATVAGVTGRDTLTEQRLQAMDFATGLAAQLFVDAGANKLKVNTDHSVNAGFTVTEGNLTDLATAVGAEIVVDIMDAMTGRTIRIDSPFAAGGALTIFSGDDYLAANGQSITATITARTDLIGMTSVLYLESGVTLTATGSVVATGTETLTFGDLTSTQTLTLWDGIGTAPTNRKYQIKFLTEAGKVTTQIDGVMHVRRGLST